MVVSVGFHATNPGFVGDAVFQKSLYQKLIPTGGSDGPTFIEAVRTFAGTFDNYCPGCKKSSTFQFIVDPDLFPTKRSEVQRWEAAQREGAMVSHPWLRSRRFELEAVCTRNRAHHVYAYFEILQVTLENKKLEISIRKIGQTPSLRDLKADASSKFISIIGAQAAQELGSARTQHSSGYSVAAYAYLRRVFEKIIDGVAERAITEGATIDGAAFEVALMPEKIRLLRNHLPTKLVSNANTYKVLSTGLHKLSEEECADIYDVLDTGIVLIADAILDEEQRKQDEAKFVSAVNAAAEKLRGKEPT